MFDCEDCKTWEDKDQVSGWAEDYMNGTLAQPYPEEELLSPGRIMFGKIMNATTESEDGYTIGTMDLNIPESCYEETKRNTLLIFLDMIIDSDVEKFDEIIGVMKTMPGFPDKDAKQCLKAFFRTISPY